MSLTDKNNYIKYLENKLDIKEHTLELKNDFMFIGVTGSRGKSTICYLVHRFLQKLGYKSVLYSSILIDSPKSIISSDEACENPIYDENMVYNAIKETIDYDARFLIIEVNERAISKGFTKNMPFDLRCLTNIIPKQNDLFYPDYVSLKQQFISESNIITKYVIELIDKDCIEIFRKLDRHQFIAITTEYLASKRGVLVKEIDYLVKPNDDKYDDINGLSFIIQNVNDNININTNLIMPYNGLNITFAYAILKI